jgi:hypothetical protein
MGNSVILLRSLGYHATLREPALASYYRQVFDSRNRAQIGEAAWLTDVR